MNIEDLINDYKKQTKIYSESQHDYSDKFSVKKCNKAVGRMYQLVQMISKKNNLNEVAKFSELLTEEENRTNIWAAVHLLEKLEYDKTSGENALKIIKKIASGNDAQALGFQYWLKDFKLK
ncbi:hypothetical protein MWU65_17320 [Cellulophaga sp. F20128]|uniref:hypothetical protein n=1 Tax=Cellulophaga sp. F20128 TaxID=2926413 RepID=UPI001FF3D5F4|nr:hypothetical protein [Cellulophaga sp. F20128]MCK0158951.1 hypothetical protein [Cellulophaga sp. F20128]